MQFLYPQFIYGLALLAVPLIIHLFNFRKVKRVYFSNTAFLHQVEKQRKTRHRLKHWLVLASRMLAVACLVFAFAQPYLPPKNGQLTENYVNIYLDNSLSASNKTAEGQTVLDEAVGRAVDLIGTFPKGTRFRLLTNEFGPSSNFYRSSEETLEALTEIKYSAATRDFGSVMGRLKTGNKASQFFWVSDFQKSTLGDPSAVTADSALKISLIPVASDKSPNIYIDSVRLGTPFLMGHEKNKLIARLGNTGEKDRYGVAIKLSVNGRRIANTSADIAAGENKEIEFDLPDGLEKINKGKISLEDFPVTYDNDYFFTLKKADPVRILEIRGDNISSDVADVYSDNEVFDFATSPANNLDYDRLKRTDLVILNGLEKIDETLAFALNDYLDGNGYALLIPAQKPDLTTYGSITRGASLTLTQDSVKRKLAQVDQQDPFYANVFEKNKERVNMPSAMRVIATGRKAHSKLSFRDGRPFLFESPRRSNLLILASPLDNAFTDLHNHALFVPVMYKLATHYRPGTSRRLAYTLDEGTAEISAEGLKPNNPVRLRQGKTELIPSGQVSGQSLILGLPKFAMSPGFYEVITDKTTPSDLLAINQAKAESFTECWDNNDLKKALANVPGVIIFESQDGQGFRNELSERFQGQALWRYALLLTLMFLLTEVLILRFFR
ncbi:membrane protein [Fulvitalea axinellae]|uniref:Membrane protein n=1 Tax=Fulvitalea axinellae TaxID=1182444 RepID=A0AAU9DD66_9BACT|nr:membrane protein [Fulvitalea axinellae]